MTIGIIVYTYIELVHAGYPQKNVCFRGESEPLTIPPVQKEPISKVPLASPKPGGWFCGCVLALQRNQVTLSLSEWKTLFHPIPSSIGQLKQLQWILPNFGGHMPLIQWMFPYSCRVKPLIEMPMISPESHPRCQKSHAVRQVRILMGFLWISSLDTSGASQYIAGHLSGASQKVGLGLSQLLSSCDPRLYPVRYA